SGACGPPPPRPKPWPGRIWRMFAPRLEICSATAAVAPLPRVTIVTTAATPMTMPSTVRKERNLCRLISRTASMMVVKNISLAPARRHPDESRDSRTRSKRIRQGGCSWMPGQVRDDDKEPEATTFSCRHPGALLDRLDQAVAEVDDGVGVGGHVGLV